jgi:hypothetical protein
VTRRAVPIRILGLIVIGVATGIALVHFWPNDPVVDGRTDIYRIQVLVYGKDGKVAPSIGTTFMQLEPYRTRAGRGTSIIVFPEQTASKAEVANDTVKLVVKVPAKLWGGRSQCDPSNKSARCTDLGNNWKNVTYTDVWRTNDKSGTFKSGVHIPPYKRVGYGVGQDSGHLDVSLPQIVIPASSQSLSPNVGMQVSNWRSYQWEGAAPQSSFTSTSADENPDFLISGSTVDGDLFAPGFTTYGSDPSQIDRDDMDLLITGALLGVLGGVLVSLVTELLPQRAGRGAGRQVQGPEKRLRAEAAKNPAK